MWKNSCLLLRSSDNSLDIYYFLVQNSRASSIQSIAHRRTPPRRCQRTLSYMCTDFLKNSLYSVQTENILSVNHVQQCNGLFSHAVSVIFPNSLQPAFAHKASSCTLQWKPSSWSPTRCLNKITKTSSMRITLVALLDTISIRST